MRRRRSGKAYRKQFCSIILAAALVMGSVMPAFAAEGGTIASEETAAVSESAAESGTVDETEQITSGEGTEQVTSGDGTEQVTSGDGTDQVMTDEDQAASDDQEKSCLQTLYQPSLQATLLYSFWARAGQGLRNLHRGRRLALPFLWWTHAGRIRRTSVSWIP